LPNSAARRRSDRERDHSVGGTIAVSWISATAVKANSWDHGIRLPTICGNRVDLRDDTIDRLRTVRGNATPGPVVNSAEVWLRSTWDINGASRFAYSEDGSNFTDFGDPYQLKWNFYRGDRIGIFNYNNLGDRGVVDVDSFTYRFER